MQGIQDLIRHLGSNPDERDPAALAEQFGLEPGVVELALRRAPARPRPEPKALKQPSGPSWFARQWQAGLASPGKFLLVATIVFFGATFLLSAVPPPDQVPAARAVAFAAFLIAQFLLYTAVVYRLKSVKWALLYAAVLPFPLAVFVSIRSPGVQGVTMAVSLIVTFAAISAVFFVPLALLSGYLIVRTEEKAKASLTRQETIMRLLEIRELLEAGTSVSARAGNSIIEWTRARMWIVLPLASMVLRLLSVAALVAIDPGRLLLAAQSNQELAAEPSFVPVTVVAMLIQFGYAAFAFFAGFVAKSFKLAFALSLVFEACGLLLLFTPFRYAPPEAVVGSNWVGPVVALAITSSIAMAGAMSNKVREHLHQSRLARENDRDALTAEMIELEWRLIPKSRQTFVVVVDVVGSTAMKQAADPLVAEFSFREYQALVRKTGENHGGKVHSTAGDGTVLGFETAESAIAFAEAMHEGMPGFNEESNRLDSPFQIRIGVHCGEVVGDLGEVQFTRVIDVAAHVEAVAPVGGTALSDEVMVSLPEGSCLPLPRNVDGHELFVPAGSRTGATIPAG